MPLPLLQRLKLYCTGTSKHTLPTPSCMFLKRNLSPCVQGQFFLATFTFTFFFPGGPTAFLAMAKITCPTQLGKPLSHIPRGCRAHSQNGEGGLPEHRRGSWLKRTKITTQDRQLNSRSLQYKSTGQVSTF